MAATPAKPAAEKLDPTVVRTALILIVGAMAVIFDTTIVSVALHTLSREAGHLGRDDPVGDHRLPAGARHRGAAQHLGPAAVRRQAAVDVLPRRLPRRLGRVQPRVGRRLAHRLAGRPGYRRRPHAPADDHAHLPGRGRQVARAARHLRRAAGVARPDPRPADRRRHPDAPELAVHVLGERAVLRRRDPARLALPENRRTRQPRRRGRQAEARRARALPHRAGHLSRSCWAWPTRAPPPGSPTRTSSSRSSSASRCSRPSPATRCARAVLSSRSGCSPGGRSPPPARCCSSPASPCTARCS